MKSNVVVLAISILGVFCQCQTNKNSSSVGGSHEIKIRDVNIRYSLANKLLQDSVYLNHSKNGTYVKQDWSEGNLSSTNYSKGIGYTDKTYDSVLYEFYQRVKFVNFVKDSSENRFYLVVKNFPDLQYGVSKAAIRYNARDTLVITPMVENLDSLIVYATYAPLNKTFPIVKEAL